MRGMLPLLLLTLCLSGCAAVSNQDSPSVDSSALITISHVYTGTELEHLDSVQVQQEALMKCQLHGYSEAEAVGSERQICTRYTGYYSCFYHRVEQQYQCSGVN